MGAISRKEMGCCCSGACCPGRPARVARVFKAIITDSDLDPLLESVEPNSEAFLAIAIQENNLSAVDALLARGWSPIPQPSGDDTNRWTNDCACCYCGCHHPSCFGFGYARRDVYKYRLNAEPVFHRLSQASSSSDPAITFLTKLCEPNRHEFTLEELRPMLTIPQQYGHVRCPFRSQVAICKIKNAFRQAMEFEGVSMTAVAGRAILASQLILPDENNSAELTEGALELLKAVQSHLDMTDGFWNVTDEAATAVAKHSERLDVDALASKHGVLSRILSATEAKLLSLRKASATEREMLLLKGDGTLVSCALKEEVLKRCHGTIAGSCKIEFKDHSCATVPRKSVMSRAEYIERMQAGSPVTIICKCMIPGTELAETTLQVWEQYTVGVVKVVFCGTEAMQCLDLDPGSIEVAYAGDMLPNSAVLCDYHVQDGAVFMLSEAAESTAAMVADPPMHQSSASKQLVAA